MLKMSIVLLAAACFMTGCAQLQNVTVDDLRSPENLRDSGEMNKTIPQIQQSMLNYGNKCRSLGRVDVDPSNESKASYKVFMPGFTDASAALLIDLNQVGDKTEYEGYTYYPTWKGHLVQTIYAMNGGLDCKK